MMAKKGIIYSVLTIFSVSIFSKIIGFFREMALANYFGTSLSIDMYYFSYGVFFALSSIVGASIGLGYISTHGRNKKLFGEKWLDKSFESFNYTLCISLLISVLFFVFSKSVASMVAGNYSLEELSILSDYIKINSLAFFFQSLSFFLISILNAEKRFGIGELAGVVYSIVVLSTLFLFYHQYGIDAIIYSFLISSIVTFITLYGVVYGYKYKITSVNFKTNSIISLSTLVGSSMIYIGQIYDRTIATNLSEGSLSALNYSGNIHSLVNTFLIISVVNVIYSEFVSIDKDRDDFLHKINALFNNSISVFIVILLPVSLFLFAFSQYIVSIVFERGAFNNESVVMTSDVFKMYVIGTVFFAINNLSVRLFYSLNDRKLPIITGIAFLLLNMLICYVFSNYWGVSGISLAVSITGICSTIVLISFLASKYRIFLESRVYVDVVKVSIFCLLAYLILDYTMQCIELDGIGKIQTSAYLAIMFMIYIASYLLYCLVLNVSVVRNFARGLIR
ncbi:murein biosynthesis integral membrane protein MurJ [Lonepinella koalarum]|nr:lipid II flippase MurJ [Lonepinella koalarum]MDH2926805.1 hypothetical protein [Lonepinella koalarum]TFJ90083.1 hypothetical protein E0709_05410 [Lonepinella koalarum]